MQEREQEVAQLEALSHAELLSWFRSHISPDSPSRRVLAVHVAGRAHMTEQTQLGSLQPIADLDAFRQSNKLYAAVGVAQ